MSTVRVGKAFLKKIADLTDENYHGECLLVIAKKFKLQKYIDGFTDVIEKHNKAGHLTYELSLKRRGLSDEMFKELAKEHGQIIVNKITSQM